jgi:hypothetical protein
MPAAGLALTTDDQAAAELEYNGTSIWTPEEAAPDAPGAAAMLETTNKKAGTRAEDTLIMQLDDSCGSASR